MQCVDLYGTIVIMNGVKIEKFTLLKSSPAGMPFSVRSVGHYQLTKDWLWPRRERKRNVIQLFWFLSGRGIFLIEGKYREAVEANMIAVYYPGDSHGIETISPSLEYAWLTIAGTEALNIIKAFQFPRKPVVSGACPEWLFRKLRNEMDDISPLGLNLAAVTAYNILSLAKSGISQKSKNMEIIDRCVDIIKNEYTNTELNVNHIADRLNMHRSQVSRIFKTEMNITLIDYLISVRHFRAVELMRTTSFPICQIAIMCGFSSTNYFIRTFKRMEKTTPAAYRHEFV